MPRPNMSHEELWEVIGGLGLQEDLVYRKTQDANTKLRHSQREQDGKHEHWQKRVADLDTRANRITDIRGRLRKLVDASTRPESMEWDT